MQKLLSWLEENDMSQADLGRVIGRNRVRAHRIVRGAKPNDEEMRLIYQATNGIITANDFFDLSSG